MIVHLVFVYGIGWLARMDLGVLTIASVATKAGPAMVPPVAEVKGVAASYSARNFDCIARVCSG